MIARHRLKFELELYHIFQRNLGRKFVSEISSSEEWKCLVCDPKQIYELRALYYELYINQKDILEKKLKRQEEQAKRRSSVSATPKKTEKPAEEAIPEAPEMIFSSDNFLEDNFGEAMKTLTDFQTLMEEEQNRWNEASKVLDPEIATSITRKLRKFYNATKQVRAIKWTTNLLTFCCYYRWQLHFCLQFEIGNLSSSNK